MDITKQICEDCGKCCQKTEMLLSEQDIRLIEENISSITREEFTELSEKGIYQLKNKDNNCVFLDITSKLCSIYEIRPQGCRFYPIIYDNEKKICIYDEECPRISQFYLDWKKFKNLCNNIKKFIKRELKIQLT
ncbi:MAG: YkgJ family cysteine cluster protein [Promethearchaeota archaeon]|jgi:Fe-S-cluster containining protein